ncbi:hypothetical protein SBADM41S_11216 [Streptomyces badius]
MKRSFSHRVAVAGRRAAMGLVVLVLLVAGAWASWTPRTTSFWPRAVTTGP